jgi:general stress protein 26
MSHAFPNEDTAKGAVRVWSLARSIKTAMLTTGPVSTTTDAASKDAIMTTRPLRARFEEHADAIWFIVRRSVVSNLGQVSSALLTFSDGADGDHLAFRGTLSPSNDRVRLKSLWDAHATIAFPQGPEDKDATLLKFEPAIATYWEGGGDIVSFLVHFIEAKMTGDPHDAVKHGTVPA